MAAINAPLIVVVGETASGKTALAIELAQKFNGEIVCADSQTIYRGVSIGVAKPTEEEQALVAHHLLDIRDPDETYNVAQFQTDASSVMVDINSRCKLPIMVGGSGLYINSVIYDYAFSSVGQRDSLNPRHIAPNTGSQDKQLRENTLVIGLQPDPEELELRIARRLDGMLEHGLVQEAQDLFSKYGREAAALNNIRYQILADYLEGGLSLEQAKQNFVHADKLLAKKQRTWFNRNKSIHWVNNPSAAVEITTTFLNNLLV